MEKIWGKSLISPPPPPRPLCGWTPAPALSQACEERRAEPEQKFKVLIVSMENVDICFCLIFQSEMSILLLLEQNSLLSILQWKYFWNMCYMIETKYFLLFSLPPRRNIFFQRHPVHFYYADIRYNSFSSFLDIVPVPWLLPVCLTRCPRCRCRGQPGAVWPGGRWGSLPSESSDQWAWAETGIETLLVIIIMSSFVDIKCE